MWPSAELREASAPRPVTGVKNSSVCVCVCVC